MRVTFEIKLAVVVEDVEGRPDCGADRVFGVDGIGVEDLGQAFETASTEELTEVLFGGTDMAVKIVEIAPSKA